jgi:hypothetical protein
MDLNLNGADFMSMKGNKMNHKKALAMLGIAAAVAYATPALLSMNQAHASGGNEGGFGGFFGGGGGPAGFGSGAGGFMINDPVTAKECGDCHQPYGADALPQGAWRRMMNDLSNHFGEDASLDDQTRTHIENYLVRNAPPGDGPLRITEQGWFVSEHRREVSQRAIQRAGSMANCAACHRQSGWTPKQ